MFPKEQQVSNTCTSELLSYVDPTVVASEKKVFFVLCYQPKKALNCTAHSIFVDDY